MDIRFNKFDYPAKIRQQRELFANAFPEVSDKSMDIYNWQFHSFPNNTLQSFEYSAYIKEEMVGYYAALPFNYKVFNLFACVGMVCGVMTSTKFRGKGIFTKLGIYSTKELESHVSFLTGFPIRKNVIPGHIKIGWKIAFELPMYIKFLKSDSILKSKKIPFLSKVINPALNIYNSLIKTNYHKDYKISFHNNVLEINDYEKFYKNWSKYTNISLIKDLKFSTWRYSRPGSKYFFSIIKNDDNIVAFVSYCKVVKEEIPSLCIIDLMILPSHQKCSNLLFSKLTEQANQMNCEVIIFMMSKICASKNKVFRNGFFKSPFRFKFIIKNLNKDFNDETLYSEKNWNLMWVDTDDL